MNDSPISAIRTRLQAASLSSASPEQTAPSVSRTATNATTSFLHCGYCLREHPEQSFAAMPCYQGQKHKMKALELRHPRELCCISYLSAHINNSDTYRKFENIPCLLACKEVLFLPVSQLYKAIHSGEFNTVRNLLTTHPCLAKIRSQGQTPILYARKCQHKVIENFIKETVIRRFHPGHITEDSDSDDSENESVSSADDLSAQTPLESRANKTISSLAEQSPAATSCIQDDAVIVIDSSDEDRESVSSESSSCNSFSGCRFYSCRTSPLTAEDINAYSEPNTPPYTKVKSLYVAQALPWACQTGDFAQIKGLLLRDDSPLKSRGTVEALLESCLEAGCFEGVAEILRYCQTDLGVYGFAWSTVNRLACSEEDQEALLNLKASVPCIEADAEHSGKPVTKAKAT